MDTEALIELYLRSAGWTKVFTPDGTGDFSWDHDQVEVLKTTEESSTWMPSSSMEGGHQREAAESSVRLLHVQVGAGLRGQAA